MKEVSQFEPLKPMFSWVELLMLGGNYDEAAIELKRIIAHKATDISAHTNLAKCYEDAGRYNDAVLTLIAILSVCPRSSRAWYALGINYQHLDNIPAAAVAFDRAATLDPNNPAVRWDRCQCFLSMGDFSAGYEGFEARMASQEAFNFTRPPTPPYWQGESLDDKHLIIWSEQGLGEQLLTATLYADLIPHCKKVTLEVVDRMVPLMKRTFPSIDVYPSNSNGDRFEAYKNADVQLPAFNVARIARQGFDDFPDLGLPVLKADEARIDYFRQKYEALAAGRPIIGISWRSTNPRRTDVKSIGLDDLKAIASQDAFFVCLQYDLKDWIEERDGLAERNIYFDHEIDYYGDFDVPLAQIGACDLVVTVSNTVLHAAGSIAIPTMAIINSGRWRHWYWFMRRSDCPWYPSVSLFRPEPATDGGKWYATSVQRVAAKIAEVIAAGKGADAAA